ncbi:unnamed protein product, partial [Prorocentrum cordatum]
MCYTWVNPQGVAAAVLVDAEYPQRVAFGLASEAVRMFLESSSRASGKAGHAAGVPSDPGAVREVPEPRGG